MTILSAVLDLFGFNQFMSHGLPWWLSGKESTCQCRRCGSDPWVGKIPLEKETATHSNTLAWEIPQTEEPGGLWCTESQRVRHDLGIKKQQQFMSRPQARSFF